MMLFWERLCENENENENAKKTKERNLGKDSAIFSSSSFPSMKIKRI